MNIGELIKKAREGKSMTQKEVALSVNMDQSQYSKIEKGKTDHGIEIHYVAKWQDGRIVSIDDFKFIPPK